MSSCVIINISSIEKGGHIMQPPYDLKTTKEFISENGITATLMLLSDHSFPQRNKDTLSKEHIIVGDFPNVTLICSLA